MTQSDLIVLARRGNADAIAQLISNSLAARGITAQAAWQGDYLEIWLQGENLPPASVLVPNLRQGFERLIVNRNIAAIRLYACRPHQNQPDWVEIFSLNPILDPLSPSEPRSEPLIDPPSEPLPESITELPPELPPKPLPEPLPEPASELTTLPPSALLIESPSDSITELPPKPLSEPLSELVTTPSPEPTPPPTNPPSPRPSLHPSTPPPLSPAPPPPEPSYLSDTALVILAHLAPLLSYLSWLGITWIGLPFLWTSSFLLPWRIVAPLALLLVKGKTSRYLRHNAQEALNFQISCTLYWLATFALMFLLVGFLLVVPLAFFEAVCIIVAAVKASDGKRFRYPLSIRFVR
ncbi:DUF4870 domain-containing protein [Pseudanabaena sp. FACHB-2040]|uniref:DUF4870 domain-containing protein n=1 Tax=Pseudanabaena sp. FACHB-2040 TaxID=2692859 RepID=UPI001688BA62|nr:DUF4870 domain-containing protein [Pseudanabaena sp. FACHB-2040]MBD2256331.1 DUF4870 domain-containing protein [Pseudanabaena sp. FACHB-2040]